MFGLFTKKYPILSKSNIKLPPDGKMSTANAKKLYKEWILGISYEEKGSFELSMRTDEFREEIKHHQDDELKEFVREARDSVKESKAEIAKLKRKIKSCKDPDDLEELNNELEAEFSFLDQHEKDLEECIQELSEFKEDKTDFLINYINTEIHGEDWRRLDPKKRYAAQ